MLRYSCPKGRENKNNFFRKVGNFMYTVFVIGEAFKPIEEPVIKECKATLNTENTVDIRHYEAINGVNPHDDGKKY